MNGLESQDSQGGQQWQADQGMLNDDAKQKVTESNSMDIPTLIHSLSLAGLTLRPGNYAASLEVVGEVQKLTLSQQQALREHKPTLLKMLSPLTTCYFQEQAEADAERDAIQFADSPNALPLLADAIQFFERLADEIQRRNPEAIAQVVLEQEPLLTPCQRCGSNKTYLAIIHAGESLRRDCAQCGRFCDFPAWHNNAEVGRILAHAIERNRYNEAGCPGEANAQASPDALPFSQKDQTLWQV